MMKKRLIVIVFGTVLLIAVAVVVALRERQPVSKPEAPVAQTPAEVRVNSQGESPRNMTDGASYRAVATSKIMLKYLHAEFDPI